MCVKGVRKGQQAATHISSIVIATRQKRAMGQNDIDRHERAKRPRLCRFIEARVRCPKCHSLFSVGIPEQGGRHCCCTICGQDLFVHKNVDRSHQSDQSYQFDQTEELYAVDNLDGPSPFTTETPPNLMILGVCQDILTNGVLIRLDMMTLSLLDCTCHDLRSNVQSVTVLHASRLNLRLRNHEKWSDLRLGIHCMWTANGMHTGMGFTSLSSGSCLPSQLHTCGSGIFEQVGHPCDLDCADLDYVLPCEVEAFRNTKIVAVSAGGRHSCVLHHDGCVHTFGKGDNGQLGNDLGVQTCDHNGSHHGPFKIIDTTTSGQAKRVVCISAGFDHSIIIHPNGKVKSFGRGMNGRLGINGQDDERTPKPITCVMDTRMRQIDSESFKNTRFIAAGAGMFHSAIISDTGELYTFGNCKNGRLGHGLVGGMRTRSGGAVDCNSGKPQVIPRKVFSLQKHRVIQVALGSYHTVVLTNKGEVFSFGYGCSGQLGLGNGEDMDTPTKVRGLELTKGGDPVVQIAAGYEHTVALTLSGLVYTFGLGKHGQLGHGSHYNELYPRMLKHLGRLYGRAVQVSAGGYHTVLRHEDGRVTTFGNNASGQLGHGDKENAYVPRLVKEIADRYVRNVSAGGGHTLLLVDPAKGSPCHV